MSASIRDFIPYASQGRPGFVQGCRGASSEEIEELTRLAGFTLPRIYQDYLSLMGHGSKDLDLTSEPKGSTDISAIIDKHERYSAEHFNTWNVLFESGSLDWDVCVEVLHRQEPRLVCVEGELICEVTCNSFTKFLFQRAFQVLRMLPIPFKFCYSTRHTRMRGKKALDWVRQAHQALGFEEKWFSEGVCYCGARDGLLVKAQQVGRYPLHGWMCSSDSSELSRAREQLMRQVPEMREESW